MAEYNTMYSQARYYDIVFNRDVSREVEFVSTLYQQHNGQSVASVLELACGPGYHARASSYVAWMALLGFYLLWHLYASPMPREEPP